MLRLEFQATRASSWYADAENSFINWEHTIGSPPSFFHQLHVHPRQIISLHDHCQYLSSIRLNIYKLYNCYQALMILAEGCLNWIKEPLIQHTEMTLYQHCWLAIFVMLIWRPNIYWLVILTCWMLRKTHKNGILWFLMVTVSLIMSEVQMDFEY